MKKKKKKKKQRNYEHFNFERNQQLYIGFFLLSIIKEKLNKIK